MGESTAGYFEQPPIEEIEDWELRGDGKWYWVGKPEHPECGQATREALMRDLACEEAAKGIGDNDSPDKGSGARYNAGKPPMQYIPFEQQLIVFAKYFEDRPDCAYLYELMQNLAAFERSESDCLALRHIISNLEVTDLHSAAYVWDYGANKYAAWNWAKGMPWSVPLACISRHIQAVVIEREDYDQESGCSHWGHIVCNLLMLDHYSRYYREGDDRPPKEVF